MMAAVVSSTVMDIPAGTGKGKKIGLRMEPHFV